VKSLVWYVPENFEDAGYEMPKTMEELKALTEQIVADGDAVVHRSRFRRCDRLAGDRLGRRHDAAHPAAVRLRRVGHQRNPVQRPRGRRHRRVRLVRPHDDYVAGGRGAVASTDFRDSPNGLFDSPPQCYMHRQASFIPAFFPEGTEIGEDADFFYFPAYADKDLGSPVLGAGTLFDHPTAPERMR
jgi:alpha-glucoside transport system substrate-binding protein